MGIVPFVMLFRHQPRVFQGLPGDLQYQPLLGIQVFRFSWRDTEEQRIHQDVRSRETIIVACLSASG